MTAKRGFTLIEIVVSLALGILIISMVAFVTVRFVQDRELEVTVQTLVSYLRSAEDRALLGADSIDHGVSYANNRLTLFRGTSYAARQQSQDTYFPYPEYVHLSGLTEVVFRKQTGAPSVAGALVLTNGFSARTVTVHSTGAISR